MKKLKNNTQKKAEFRIHVIVYLAVISLLTIINLTITPGYFWAKWPMMGWGLAIIIHGISTYYTFGESGLRNE